MPSPFSVPPPLLPNRLPLPPNAYAVTVVGAEPKVCEAPSEPPPAKLMVVQKAGPAQRDVKTRAVASLNFTVEPPISASLRMGGINFLCSSSSTRRAKPNRATQLHPDTHMPLDKCLIMFGLCLSTEARIEETPNRKHRGCGRRQCENFCTQKGQWPDQGQIVDWIEDGSGGRRAEGHTRCGESAPSVTQMGRAVRGLAS